MDRKTVGFELMLTSSGDLIGIRLWENREYPVELTPAQIMVIAKLIRVP